MQHTSIESEIAIQQDTSRLRRVVYESILLSGEKGRTDEEVQDLTRMNPSTQRPRRIELQRDGAVYDSGRRRSTKSGRSAIVWQAR